MGYMLTRWASVIHGMVATWSLECVPMEDYRVQLDTYSGPMDLLLYLIRREEVDIYDIPIARILEQYLEYVRVLEVLDPEAVGEFLVLAATLMEIKSRMLLPRVLPEEAEGDEALDPRADLVRQLLAYRSFRDAAGALSQRAELHARRFGRPPVELPGEEQHVDIEDVQVWDLLAAFNKLMTSVGSQRAFHEVKYDDTPITLHAVDISDRLLREGKSLYFEQIFEGRTRSEMIGLFLALLELIRQKRVRIEQNDRFGPILVHLVDATPITDPDRLVEQEESSAGGGGGQEGGEAPFEDEGSAVEAGDGIVTAAGLADEEEDQDEFARQIQAIEIGEVKLGRADDVEEPDEESGRDEPHAEL
ncbi:MAG TPA: segregation/condensation protein A [Phycisphaerae bacterium]|nr:segregation/condensation protein A [Phycisphaerae bacterium]HRY69456.1 segregation/condensation protein A [Phycisphaerae bacterium]